jgi:hypothetical protein
LSLSGIGIVMEEIRERLPDLMPWLSGRGRQEAESAIAIVAIVASAAFLMLSFMKFLHRIMSAHGL